jgi:hypothetical protein
VSADGGRAGGGVAASGQGGGGAGEVHRGVEPTAAHLGGADGGSQDLVGETGDEWCGAARSVFAEQVEGSTTRCAASG